MINLFQAFSINLKVHLSNIADAMTQHATFFMLQPRENSNWMLSVIIAYKVHFSTDIEW